MVNIDDLEVPEHDPETEYLETVLRFRVFRQYVGADARDDAPWSLYMSSITHQGAKDAVYNDQKRTDIFAYKIVDNKEHSLIVRSQW